MSVRITHAQPLVPDEDGRLCARPLLSEVEAALEARSMQWGCEDVIWEFGDTEGEDLGGWYTHRVRLVSGPPHLCREYLIRLAG